LEVLEDAGECGGCGDGIGEGPSRGEGGEGAVEVGLDGLDGGGVIAAAYGLAERDEGVSGVAAGERDLSEGVEDVRVFAAGELGALLSDVVEELSGAGEVAEGELGASEAGA
jgi:hypothetical protein